MNTNLVEALRDVLQATNEETAAREKYDGYDWGYYGFQWAEARRKAEEAFTAALDAAIDARIAERLKQPKEPT